jgi:hypothetical protein
MTCLRDFVFRGLHNILPTKTVVTCNWLYNVYRHICIPVYVLHMHSIYIMAYISLVFSIMNKNLRNCGKLEYETKWSQAILYSFLVSVWKHKIWKIFSMPVDNIKIVAPWFFVKNITYFIATISRFYNLVFVYYGKVLLSHTHTHTHARALQCCITTRLLLRIDQVSMWYIELWKLYRNINSLCYKALIILVLFYFNSLAGSGTNSKKVCNVTRKL